jgi:cell wall-associated NlpC family hydrolase
MTFGKRGSWRNRRHSNHSPAGSCGSPARQPLGQHPAPPQAQCGHPAVGWRTSAMTRSRIMAALLSAGLMAGTLLASAPQAHASTRGSARLAAFNWARTQAGKPYRYGGTGPGSYDCSGLVYAAYRHAGITLPRTTQQMLASGKFGRTRSPRPGDLAFFGSGHVEIVTRASHLTFGALHPGTSVWWHRWYSGSGWRPTTYLYVRGAH